jgi:hypothetical protein
MLSPPQISIAPQEASPSTIDMIAPAVFERFQ